MNIHDLQTVAILDVNVEMTSKRENNNLRMSAMQQFVENDSSTAPLAHLTQDVLFFMFSELQTRANLDFELIMIPTKNYKSNHFSLFVMLKLEEKDPTFVLLAHQAPEILHFMFFYKLRRWPFPKLRSSLHFQKGIEAFFLKNV